MQSDDDARVTDAHQPITTTFLVIRHAQSEANSGGFFASQSDSPLSAAGIRQAEALTDACRHLTIDAVVSSDLSRARDTVAGLARARGLVVETTPALRERAMGELTGQTFDHVQRAYPELYRALAARDPDVAPPRGESHRQLYQRVSACLDALAARHRGATIVISSHGGAIHHVIRHLSGLLDVAEGPWFSVDNASVTRVEQHVSSTGRRSSRLVYVNRIVGGDDRAPLLPGRPRFIVSVGPCPTWKPRSAQRSRTRSTAPTSSASARSTRGRSATTT